MAAEMEHRNPRIDFLFALPAAQIRTYYVTLDRPRPHDRNLDYQVIKCPWFQTE